MQGKKNNQKSRTSASKKTQLSKRSVNHKQKIAQAIKKSTLTVYNTTKIRSSSKNKKVQTQKKIAKNPYEIESHRHKAVKAMSTISKSMPIRNQKQKLLQFPFQAIKFKQKANNQVINSKTHEGFFIQYDQPQEAQIDMSLLNNSKKIIGSYNQRVGRYSQLKSKPLIQSSSNEIKNPQFKQSLRKIFRFLDPHSNMVISHGQIDYRLLPQGVLYFLGGLFHRMRERHLLLSENQFMQECTLLYKRSSDEDIKWFIQDVSKLTAKQITRTKANKEQTSVKVQLNDFTTVCEDKSQTQTNFKQNQIIQQNNLKNNAQGYNNVSFDGEQQFGVSFRKQSKENEYDSKGSHQTQRQSIESANFGPFQHRFSFNQNFSKDSFSEFPQQIFSLSHMDDKNKQRNEVNEMFKSKQKPQEFSVPIGKTGGIKKNMIDKAEDLRQQIYAKMDKLKIYPENKQNYLLKQNFTSNSKPVLIKNPSILNNNEMLTNNVDPIKNISIKQKNMIESSETKKFKQQMKNPLNQVQFVNSKTQQTQKSFNRQPLTQKNTSWMNKNKNCSDAFQKLKKMQQDFKNQKKIIEKRQETRQNNIRQNIKQKNTLIEDFILEEETRILKLTQKKQIIQKPSNSQSIKYERNIDRLSILSNSRNKNQKSINLNDSLVNSCRKSLQVSLPLRHSGYKGMSFSDRKVSGVQKIDKIEELSQRIENYLKSSAQKIQYSKNFTESSVTTGYNKILAM